MYEHGRDLDLALEHTTNTPPEVEYHFLRVSYARAFHYEAAH